MKKNTGIVVTSGSLQSKNILVGKRTKIESITNSSSEQLPNTNDQDLKQVKKKIFISHSTKDKEIVEKVIDLLEIIGIKSNQIFCSSYEGYGVELGENFLYRIKNELNSNVFALFILSENYYRSVISLCEMGAIWIQSKDQIPILIPPFNYNHKQDVLPNTHSMKVNEPNKWNSLKKQITSIFELEEIDFSIWERKRNNILNSVNSIIKS